MPWVPSSDFEREIVDLQPDHDFIYARLQDEVEAERASPIPTFHFGLARRSRHNGAVTQRQQQQQQIADAQQPPQEQSTLQLITKVQQIAKSKPANHLPSLNDWETYDDMEREAVALMRHCGLQPSYDAPLDASKTIATHPVEKDYVIMQNGHTKIPIFFHEKYFKLQPRHPQKHQQEQQPPTTQQSAAIAAEASSSEVAEEKQQQQISLQEKWYIRNIRDFVPLHEQPSSSDLATFSSDDSRSLSSDGSFKHLLQQYNRSLAASSTDTASTYLSDSSSVKSTSSKKSKRNKPCTLQEFYAKYGSSTNSCSSNKCHRNTAFDLEQFIANMENSSAHVPYFSLNAAHDQRYDDLNLSKEIDFPTLRKSSKK